MCNLRYQFLVRIFTIFLQMGKISESFTFKHFLERRLGKIVIL